MKEFYTRVLKNLDPKTVLEDLNEFGNNVIILCYEDSFEFCHRHLVAAWLEKELKIRIPEVAINENGTMVILSRNIKYIKQFYDIMNLCDNT